MPAPVELPGAAGRRKRICPVCQAPIRQRSHQVSLEAVRYHYSCATDRGLIPFKPGRPPSARGRTAPKVTVRLSAAEAERIAADSERAGVSSGELLRRAYFGT
jgi:hypothetical protein